MNAQPTAATQSRTVKIVPHTSEKSGEQGMGHSLQLRVNMLRLLCYRRVLWQRYLWQRVGRYPAQGLAIPHEEVDIACLDLDSPAAERRFYDTDPNVREVNAEIERCTQELAKAKGRLEKLSQIFSLSTAEKDFLVLCAAPEFDARVRRLYGYIHDDVSLCSASVWLFGKLFENNSGWRPEPSCNLVRWLLAMPAHRETNDSVLLAKWQTDRRIVGYLLGSDELDPHLADAAEFILPHPEPPYEPAAAQALRQWAKAAAHSKQRSVQIIGASGIGRKTWAARALRDQGTGMLSLKTDRLLPKREVPIGPREQSRLREMLIISEREALLQECSLFWDRAGQVAEDCWESLRFEASPQIFGTDEPIRFNHDQVHVDLLQMDLPDREQSSRLWNHYLGTNRKRVNVDLLVERFTLTPAEVRLLAPKAGESEQALWEGCRSLSRGRLGRLAAILPCPFSWDDIILPPDSETHLREIAAHALHRTTVYDTWGFGLKRPTGRGLSALFAGSSGTGKTMAAQVLASHLGVVLFRIDLAAVVSKYIGETEKNLRSIFDEAERLNAVIFFDEADALFGKRTEVKDSHDRYANIEVNYLLQRMESYDGLAILATNRKGDIDPAFLRRLRFIVDFPMPSAEERLRIWQRALPSHSPAGDRIRDEMDFDDLSRKLEISGASIKDIALGAAFLACDERSPISMKHVFGAAKREMAKHGRLVG